MAGIENLQNRITKDYEDRAKQIEKDAKAKADETLRQAKNKAEEIMSNMKVKAERDGKERKERLMARAELDARNELLFAKQEAIDNVLGHVADRITQMGDKDYHEFIQKLLLISVETGEEEIVFSEKDKARIDSAILTEINSKLVAMGKKGMLKISSTTREIGAGFILVHGGLEINCSMDSQIRLLRDNLESEISNLLFEGR